MSESVATATMRLSVVGDDGRVDLVAPQWAQVGDVAERYAGQLGLATTPHLLTVAGRVLEPVAALEEAGVRSGAMLVAAPLARGRERETEPGPAIGEPRVPVSVAWPAWVPTVGALVVLLGGATVAVSAYSASEPLRLPTVVVLLLAGLVCLAPLGAGRARLRRLHVAPLCFGSAALVVTSAEGPPLLVVVVAALGVLAGAGAARGLTDRDDPVTWVSLVAASSVVAAGAALLVVGAGTTALWGVLAGIPVLVARSLPGQVVDVEDDVLLDVSTMADTAWSAREAPRVGRGRRLVRRDTVETVVERGRVLLRTGTVACLALAVPASVLLLRALEGDQPWWREAGTQLAVAAAAGGVALSARSYRDPVLRLLLRVAAAMLLAAVVVGVLEDGPAWSGAAVLAAGLVGGVAAARAAVALGEGWRSVWWARAGDVAQGLCFVLVLGLLPLSTGLAGWVWGL